MLKSAYLASPYSDKDETVRQHRYEEVCRAAKHVAQNLGYAVYSPIAHWHPIAVRFGLPTDAIFWRNQNEGIMNSVDAIIVLQLPGWVASHGVDMEIKFAKEHNKELIFIDPEEIK